MSGRFNTNPKTDSRWREARMHESFYSALHKVRVESVNFATGKINACYVDGDRPLTIPIPLIGFSMPPSLDQKNPSEKFYKKASWGVHYPQKDDILIIGFDVCGEPFTLGYAAYDFAIMNTYDQINEDAGGIGWGDASGVRLKPGDWTYKSSRGCAFYLGERARISSGPHSITLDQSLSNTRITIGTGLLQTMAGSASEERFGNVMRVAVPTESTESFITDPSTGSTAQEHTRFIRTGNVPGGLLAVHMAEGQVIDEKLAQVATPTLLEPTMTSLAGTGVRIYRAVKDPMGLTSLYSNVIDDLGNYAVSAKTATGFQWITPLAAWDVKSGSVEWTTTTSFKLSATTEIDLTAILGLSLTSGLEMSLTSGATLDLKSVGKLTLTAPAIALAAASISLGSSPVSLTADGPLTFTAPSTIFKSASLQVGGATAADPLVKHTEFASLIGAYLTAAAAAFTSLATVAPSCTPAAAAATAAAAGMVSMGSQTLKVTV